jgi:lipopolysaccharide biosynthesis protein
MEYLCKNVFSDERYIRINNKPLFVLYHIYLFEDINKTIEIWRKICKDNGFEDIFILNVMMPDLTEVDPTTYGFDAIMQFAPIATHKQKSSVRTLNPQFKGEVYSYQAVVNSEINREFKHKNVVRCAFMSWDNEARRPTKGISYEGASPQLFFEYLNSISKFAQKNKIDGDSFVFINAWNEWAEGAHLEPDREYGYAWLDVVAKVINMNNEVNHE